MTTTDEFPLILSPNLGCPHIIAINELEREGTIPIILAGQYPGGAIPLKEDFKETLFLRPSISKDKTAKDIPLHIQDELEEITEWNQLSDFNDILDTREMINSELHYNVLGKGTRYWRIKARLNAENKENYKFLLRQKDGKYLPCLYDLVYVKKHKEYVENIWEKNNRHAIQFVESIETDCKFIHITDPHTAKRNDEILDEVLKEKSDRSREKIEIDYINFNKNLRLFIRHANEMADKGELDFVVITGDLVDFAFHGWEDETNPDENNWKTFINIITGGGNEKERNNTGLKVAVFTSTGNHDWRLHPYNPNLTAYNRKSVGLEKKELEHYNYKSFDSSEYPEDERTKLSKMLSDKTFNRINLNALSGNWKIKFTKYFYNTFANNIIKFLPLSLFGVAGGTGYRNYIYYIIFGVTGLVFWGIKLLIEYLIKKYVNMIIDNPLHAEASALHYYLKYINPYLDYAFRYGKHSFVIMDTGSDVFIGNLLDKDQLKYIKKMSFQDNILGGSPDTRAFDSEQTYCNWSQIAWLEKAMNSISKKSDAGGKTFIFLHSPPINSADDEEFDKKQNQLLESNRSGKAHKWISEEECCLTYGTVNFYLSQFFYLCTGYRESELVGQNVRRQKPVDIVFSGHAHRNIEFRIEKDNDHKIRIYHDKYSDNFNPNKPDAWWGKGSPVIVQTASCGLPGRKDKHPPYYRKVTVNTNNRITEFKQAHCSD